MNKNLISSLRGKYVGETRDFGNTNDNWTDQILTDYFVFDLVNSYNLFELLRGYFFNVCWRFIPWIS